MRLRSLIVVLAALLMPACTPADRASDGQSAGQGSASPSSVEASRAPTGSRLLVKELDYTGEPEDDPSGYTSEVLIGHDDSLYLVTETGIHKFDSTSGEEVAALALNGGVDAAFVKDRLYVSVQHPVGGGVVGFDVVTVDAALTRTISKTPIPDNRELAGIADADGRVLIAVADGANNRLAYLENGRITFGALLPPTRFVGLTYAAGSVWQTDDSDVVQRVDAGSGEVKQSWQGLQNPLGLEARSSGAYVAADEGDAGARVYELLPSGDSRPMTSPVAAPTLIAIGDDLVWIAAGATLTGIDRNTRETTTTAQLPFESFDDTLAVGRAVWLVGRHANEGNLYLIRYQ